MDPRDCPGQLRGATCAIRTTAGDVQHPDNCRARVSVLLQAAGSLPSHAQALHLLPKKVYTVC